ncbi:glycosyltransferase family 4 protein [Spirochaeta cellobiosiphila]|uniref:glycosyltransferase family 4 protein n=1 Tax=Spirochaeta cellobiosiphila TaxID=504483 RepID=UPI000407DE5D|nr:glycosyltransferase family 4 protein [Spirochaeta cellobiosiphila]
MKIAYIITRGDHFGGAQIHVRDMCIHLLKLGHQVEVIVGSRGDFTKQLESHNIPFYHIQELQRSISPIKDYVAYRKIRSVIIKNNYDILSTHTSKAGIVGRYAAHKLKTKVIFTAHGWAFTDGVGDFKQKVYAAIERHFSRFCDRIITVSRNDFDLALRFNVATEKKMKVIHNGLPLLEEIKREFKEAFTSDNPLQMVMVSRFQKQKDHFTLLKALKELKGLYWVCNFIGDGPLENSVKKMVHEYGLEKQVVFHNKRNDVPDFLKKVDLFLLISNWEGFPRSTLEAMRASLPVIVSDVGGSRESIIEDKTGFIVPHGDNIIVKERIEYFLNNPKDVLNFGLEGRKHYVENFTFATMFDKTFTLYKSVLGV